MKLTELDAAFLRIEHRDGVTMFVEVDNIEQAQGVRFLCPKCFAENSGAAGTHGVICWSRSRGVPDDQSPAPGRWALSGTGLGDLTLNADPPSQARSVQLNGGCAWHGSVTSGEAA